MVGIDRGDTISQQPWSSVARCIGGTGWQSGVGRTSHPGLTSIDNRSGPSRIRGRDWRLIASPGDTPVGCQDRLIAFDFVAFHRVILPRLEWMMVFRG